MSWADGAGARAVLYFVAAGACVVASRRDRGRVGYWAPFWVLIGGLLLVLGVGRAGAEAFVDLVRDEARAHGVYDSRRRVQAAFVVVIGGAWMATIAYSVLRVPARRRHYLPALVATVTLAASGAVRAVSLHHIDSVLQRREWLGLRVGAWIEYSLAALAIVAILRTPQADA